MRSCAFATITLAIWRFFFEMRPTSSHIANPFRNALAADAGLLLHLMRKVLEHVYSLCNGHDLMCLFVCFEDSGTDVGLVMAESGCDF